MAKTPRILIAGTHSGAGKTSVTLALLSAMTRKGMKVQGFKVGPDYIDPSYHTAVTGRPCRNLDSWMLSQDANRWIFSNAMAGADVGVVEGVMGLFDGLGGQSETASTAEMAKILKIPVVLVLDAHGLSRSAAALVQGYKGFDPSVRVVGAILNRVSGEKHAKLIKEAVENYARIPVLGYLPKDESIRIAERHLGLVTAQEHGGLKDVADRLGEQASRFFDLERILRMAGGVPALPASAMAVDLPENTGSVRIAVAMDKAFSFYYRDNLDILEKMGAEIVPFSPLDDGGLPDASAVYWGGGFPEVYSDELESNRAMIKSVREKITQGLPAYAECGGLMYLSEAIIDREGKEHAMSGVIPNRVEMTDRLQDFGYSEATLRQETVLAGVGEQIRGHEFHYSRWQMDVTDARAAYSISKPRTGKTRLEGYAAGSLLASYLHIHFLANPGWARNFLNAAANFGRKMALAALSLAFLGPFALAESEEQIALKIVETAQTRLGRTFPPQALQVKTTEESLRFLDPDSRIIKIRRPAMYFKRKNDDAIEAVRKKSAGYLRIRWFDGQSRRKAIRILNDWQRSRLSGLILDLRGNPGGRFDEAVDLLGALVRDRAPGIRFVGLNGQVKDYAIEGQAIFDCPIVLLADDQTASSAELMTLFMSRHGRCRSVGTPMKGKQTVQEIIPLDAHNALMLTVGRYEIAGVHDPSAWKPEFFVAEPERQLSTAWQILRAGGSEQR